MDGPCCVCWFFLVSSGDLNARFGIYLCVYCVQLKVEKDRVLAAREGGRKGGGGKQGGGEGERLHDGIRIFPVSLEAQKKKQMIDVHIFICNHRS